MANLPISKLRLFLLTAGNPLETELFVRAGRNEVGGARLFHSTRLKIVRHLRDTTEDLGTPLKTDEHNQAGQE